MKQLARTPARWPLPLTPSPALSPAGKGSLSTLVLQAAGMFSGGYEPGGGTREPSSATSRARPFTSFPTQNQTRLQSLFLCTPYNQRRMHAQLFRG